MNKSLLILTTAAALLLTPAALSLAGAASARNQAIAPTQGQIIGGPPGRSTPAARPAPLPAATAPVLAAPNCRAAVRVVYAGHGEPPCTAPASLADLKAAAQ